MFSLRSGAQRRRIKKLGSQMSDDIKSTEEIPAKIEYDQADDVVFVLTSDGIWSSLPANAVPDSLEEFLELPPHHHYGVLMERLLKDHEALDICAVLYSWICESDMTAEDLDRARQALELLGFFKEGSQPKKPEPQYCDWLKVDE